ncbi:MAG TPA: patatin-like phospholipase family protein [Actinomycetota bacterium]|nr:patatin-like phospholipase family protein [Actinomycetota bacterium]
MAGQGTTPSRAQWLRRLARRRRDKTAFVFSGGGPLAALQVGALKALTERGVKPDLVVGTSAGALNATWTAMDPTPDGIQELERRWRRLRDGDLFPGGRFKASWARMLVKGNRVFENSGLKRIIEESIGSEARFEETQIPLGVTATELETGAERVFTSGDLYLPLLASSAMPGIFPPIEVEGRLYIDGGVADNVPIVPAVELGGKTLYVMNSTSHSRQRRPLARPIDYLLHAFSLARSQRLGLDVGHYRDRVKIVMLPTPRLDFFVPFASMEHTGLLIELAHKHTLRFLDGQIDGREAELEIGDGAIEVIVPASEEASK